MRLRRPVLAVLTCAAVALAGCGSSGLLEGDSASELQQSLGSVRTAIDDGRCSAARSAARAGSERVDELPDSVDGELRDRLRQGFDELAQRVESDCEERTVTTTPPTTTTTTPEEPTLPETTTSTPSTPETPSTTEPSTPTDPGTDPLEPVDPTDPVEPDDDSGGVAPGVDGPGASERSASGRSGTAPGLRKRWKEFKDRMRDELKGEGRG